MRLRFERAKRSLGVRWWFGAVAGLWLGLAAAAAWLSAHLALDAPLCPMRLVAAVPCPFCGTSRAGLRALEGRLLDAWRLNPLAATLVAVAAAVLFCRLALGRRIAVELSACERRAAWAVGALLLAGNWRYVIACVG